MPTKYLNIDFYQVKVEDKAERSFVELLEAIQTIPDTEARAQHRSDDAIRLQTVKKTQVAWRGDMLRIRMNEAPVKAKLSGETREIELDEDEGLGEETAFMYNIATEILVIQRNRLGVSASALAKYFKALCKAKKVTFQPILKEDALKRISRMEIVRTFEIHFAGVKNAATMKGKGHSARSMYSVLDEYEAPNATIRLSMGHRPGGLQNVISTVRDLFSINAEQTAEEVKKVIVIGSEGEGEDREMVDLLADRLTELVQVEVKDGGRISDNQRFKAIHTAWERHQVYLESHYGPAE